MSEAWSRLQVKFWSSIFLLGSASVPLKKMARWSEITKNTVPADKQENVLNFLWANQLLHSQGLSLMVYSPFGIKAKLSKQSVDLIWCSVSSMDAQEDG